MTNAGEKGATLHEKGEAIETHQKTPCFRIVSPLGLAKRRLVQGTPRDLTNGERTNDSRALLRTHTNFMTAEKPQAHICYCSTARAWIRAVEGLLSRGLLEQDTAHGNCTAPAHLVLYSESFSTPTPAGRPASPHYLNRITRTRAKALTAIGLIGY